MMLILLGTCAVNAQVLNFKTTGFSYKYKDGYSWTNWSALEKSNMSLTIDMNNDIVTIYSPNVQVYGIYSHEGNYYDSDGDYNMVFKFIDQDGDYGTMSLIQRVNGHSEVYIRFSNIQWCYRVIRL